MCKRINISGFALTGVDESETMKVARSGGADPDGNQHGDLYVTFKVFSIISCLHW